MAQDKKIRCVSCGKPIAEEISIQAGYVKITCRCGTVNEIKAEQKQQAPYGERLELVIKDEPRIQLDIDTSKNSVLNTRKRRFI